MTTFAVLYDTGAVPAGEIAAGLADLGDIVFVVPDGSAHVEQLRPVMEMLGDVRPLTPSATDLAREIRPDAVLTFSEQMLRPAAALAAAAGRPGQTPETALLCTDKGRQRQAMAAAGVDATRTKVVTSPADWWPAIEQVGLPAIVKPVVGRSSRDTFALTSPADAESVGDAIAGLDGPFIVEEYLVGRPSEPFGDYVSVESLCAPTGITHFAMTGKTPVWPPFRGTGRLWPSHLSADEEKEVFDLVTRALDAIGATAGFAHTELKLTPDGPRIIEINGRLSAHVNMMARDACGLDLVRVGGLAALGEQPAIGTFDFGGRTHYGYNNLAPVRPCRLESVDGAEAVLAMPGVAAYRNFARPGDALPGGTMKFELDTMSGTADSPHAAVAAINAARAALTYELSFEDGTKKLTALELPDY